MLTMSSNDTIFEPKQERSKRTQQKLLDALHQCLEEKFFEHISIQEIAQKADVSVGSYYRRFKNKESLLPMLYEDFSKDLVEWITTLEAQEFDDLHQAIKVLNQETRAFLTTKKSVFRTLHINSRIYPEFISAQRLANRRTEYQRLAEIILRFRDEIKVSDAQAAADLVVHTCVNGIMDKVLYADLTPAIASKLAIDDYVDALTEMQYKYLSR